MADLHAEVILWHKNDNAEDVTTISVTAINATLRHFKNYQNAWVTVMITDDEHIRELNRNFMGHDTPTDVLAFNEDSGWNEGAPPDSLKTPGHDFLARGDLQRLGDIAVSLPQVKRQAIQANKHWHEELTMLVIHGLLHLLGYNHETPEQASKMFSLTSDIIHSLTDTIGNIYREHRRTVNPATE